MLSEFAVIIAGMAGRCHQGCDHSVTTKSHRQYRARMKPSAAGNAYG
jgi:hypothetical protein